ncbi:single-stranded DNA-binding protein [Synergistales bacterium]|nr:single-stranded DNA-binding protein [Synergistales bacterium]
MSMNKVILQGNVGKEPEERALQNGTKVASFSIATNRTWTDKRSSEKQTETTWHNCVAFGSTADVILRYVHKGDPTLVEGRLVNNKNEKTGITYTKVYVENAVLLPNKRDGGNSRQYEPGGYGAFTDDDDMPFAGGSEDAPF